MTLEVKALLEADWQVEVIALTSDASGESRKGRMDLVKAVPSLVGPDCYSHQVCANYPTRQSYANHNILLQINLIVGNYFGCGDPLILIFSAKATGLITWLRSKTQVLGLIRDIQVALNNANPGSSRQVLSVIRAVLTRWTAHYLSYQRLLNLRRTLEIMVENDDKLRPQDKIVVNGDRSSRTKATEMVSVIKDPLFWHWIARCETCLILPMLCILISTFNRMKKHLEPLALAACITQTAHCRLDQVLLVFGLLFAEYRQLIDEGDDSAGLTAILDSIESRWAKCDQEVFIAAIILNPIYKTAPFANLPILNLAGIYALLCRLWKRFYGTAPPQTLRAELKDYIDNRGAYENLSDWASEVRREAETNVNLQFLLIYVVS